MWPGIVILHLWHACFLLRHSKLRPEVQYRSEIRRNSDSRRRAWTSSQKLAINSSFICKQSAFSIRRSFHYPGTVSPKLAKQSIITCSFQGRPISFFPHSSYKNLSAARLSYHCSVAWTGLGCFTQLLPLGLWHPREQYIYQNHHHLQ